MGASSSISNNYRYNQLASSPRKRKSLKPNKVMTNHLHGWHPLHAAAYYGDITQVRKLLLNGAYVNAIDTKGRTALHFARARRHGKLNDMISELLLSAGAKDHTPLDKFGRAPNDVLKQYANRRK
jgi:ankyrin repeat protein